MIRSKLWKRRNFQFPVHKLIKMDIGHWKKEVGKVAFGEDRVLWNVKREKKDKLQCTWGAETV